MKAVTDTKLIQKGQKIGRIASFAGLIVLIAGLVISFQQRESVQPFMMLLVYGSLLVGFILSNVGIYLANRWVREPRADQSLTKVLKGLDNRYVLYNYVLPSQHVLLSPDGLTAITVKRQEGTISCDGSRWRHKLTFGRLLRLLTDEGLGNPTKEAQHEAGLLRRLVDQKLPGQDVPIATLIVFAGRKEKLDLRVNNPTVPVLPLSELKGAIRDITTERPRLGGGAYQQLVEAFSAFTAAEATEA